MGCVGTMDDVVFKDSQIKAVTPIQNLVQSKTKTIKVGTANLQTFSPFQYILTDKHPHIRQHVQSTCFDQDKLDLYFIQTYERYPQRLITKQKKYRQLLQILHNQTVKRYCPLTNQEVGIMSEQKTQIMYDFIDIGKSKQKSEVKQRNRKIKLMNTKEFCEKWDEQFKIIKSEQAYKNIRKKIFTQFSSSQTMKSMIKDLKQFDLICYHSLLLFNQQINQATNLKPQQPQQPQQQPQSIPLPLINVLLKAPLIDEQLTNLECCEDIQRIIKKGEFMKYIWMMKQLFSKACLNQNNRIQKLVSWLEKNNVDVVFLQDVRSKDVELLKVLLKGHRIVHSDHNLAAILVEERLVRTFELDYANLTLTGHNARYLSSSKIETNSKSWITKQLNKTTNSLFKKTSNNNENKSLIRDIKYMLQHDSQDGQQKQKNNAMFINHLPQYSPFNYQWDDSGGANQGMAFDQEIEGVVEQETELQKQYKDILQNLTIQIVDKVQTILQQHNQPQPPKQPLLSSPNPTPNPKHPKRPKHHNRQHQKKPKNALLQQYKNNPNIILMNKQKFLQQQNIFNQTIFNNNLIQFIGSLILISAHVKNQQNGSVTQMREKLIELRRTFPYHTIIVGVCTEPKQSKSKYKIVDMMKKFRKVRAKQMEDSEQQIMNTFYFAPDMYDAVPGIFFQDKCAIDAKKLKSLCQKNGYYTSSKKKTALQITEEQRNSSYIGVDNFIITNKQILNYQIVSCEQNISNNKDYCKQEHIIPNQQHPFANYFVVASVHVEIKQVVIDDQILMQEE